MKLEHKSFYAKYEENIHKVANLIYDTMKNKKVPVAWIDREDTLQALRLLEHQGSLAIVSLNRAFDALGKDVAITAYDHEFLLVLTDPMILDIWEEEQEEPEDEDDNSKPEIEDMDDNMLYDDIMEIIDKDDDEEDDDEEDDRNNNIRQLTMSPKGLRYDDEGSENDLFEYVCEFCGIYKAVRPRCNKCEVEK
jgi:hypothetical protein